MWLERISMSLLGLALPIITFGQFYVHGKVTDAHGAGLFAANVSLTNSTIGTFTNLDGTFTLEIPTVHSSESLKVSIVGFKTATYRLDEVKQKSSFVIALKEDARLLKDILIKANSPVTEEFSVKKIERLQIYNNPIAAADPLRAVASLPASTNLDESANVALRGSSASRSIVIFNGVPIRNPVRNTQINGIGNFSLFNTEVIDNQIVYASNPPLVYGNASAGLVDISTRRRLETSDLQLSIGLANAGVFVSHHKKNKNFIQLYSNYQFSDLFTDINSDSRIKYFKTNDIGLNLHRALGEQTNLNLFSYAIDESAAARANVLNYSGPSKSERVRNFNVFNIEHRIKNSVLRLDYGGDFINSKFDFGNIVSDQSSQEHFVGLNSKFFFGKDITFQSGMSFRFYETNFQDDEPRYYFALSPEAPSSFIDTTLTSRLADVYVYAKKSWDKLKIAGGVRTSSYLPESNHLFSSQLNIRYDYNPDHSFLLAGGYYHNYSDPTARVKRILQLSSRQLALEYDYAKNGWNLEMAGFFKEESGGTVQVSGLEQIDINDTQIFGIELGARKEVARYLQASFAYTFLESRLKVDDGVARSSNDLDYLIKSALSYNHPKIASISVSYVGRPGTYYTPVEQAQFNEGLGLIIPEFGALNSAQLSAYNSLNLSITRVFYLNTYRITAFGSVSNLLNTKNPRGEFYNSDFTNLDFDFLQMRTIYFGAVIGFDFTKLWRK